MEYAIPVSVTSPCRSSDTAPFFSPENPAARPCRSTMPNCSLAMSGSSRSSAMMHLRRRALLELAEDESLIRARPIHAACAAATPLPGTTMAWMSRRSFAGNPSIPACVTHVADAMTTVPVLRSTAVMDHVAKADDAYSNTRAARLRTRFIPEAPSSELYRPGMRVLNGAAGCDKLRDLGSPPINQGGGRVGDYVSSYLCAARGGRIAGGFPGRSGLHRVDRAVRGGQAPDCGSPRVRIAFKSKHLARAAESPANAEVNTDALYRVLRMLASVGVFEETSPRRFANNAGRRHAAHGRCLARSVTWLWMTDPFHFRVYADAMHSVTTGTAGRREGRRHAGVRVLRARPGAVGECSTTR